MMPDLEKWNSKGSLLWIHGKHISVLPPSRLWLLMVSHFTAGSGKKVLWFVFLRKYSTVLRKLVSSQLRNHRKIRRKAQLPLSSSMAYFNFAFRDTHEQIYHDIVSSLLPVVYSVEPCHDILYCFYWYTAAAHRSILIAFDQMPERHALNAKRSL